ncbi:MAG: hypothetical protein WCS28_11575, partial [Thiomicrospira sp.]
KKPREAANITKRHDITAKLARSAKRKSCGLPHHLRRAKPEQESEANAGGFKGGEFPLSLKLRSNFLTGFSSPKTAGFAFSIVSSCF